MSRTSSTYQSKLYQSFLEISEKEHRSIIRFYEDKQAPILHLEFKERFDILIAYVNALFEQGQYEKLLSTADEAIELTMLQNIKIHKGYNIFQRLLFQKAHAHFHLMEYAQSEHILQELIKICPSEDDYANAYKRVLLRQTPNYIQSTRATGIFFFILTAAIVLVEILIVRPLFKDWILSIELTRWGTFLMGWLVLAIGFGYFYWSVHKKTNVLIKKVKADKLRRQRQRHQKQQMVL